MFRRVSSFVLFHSLVCLAILVLLIGGLVGALSEADQGLRVASLGIWQKMVIAASVYFLPVVYLFPPTRDYPLVMEWAIVFSSVFATGLPITMTIRFRLIGRLWRRLLRRVRPDQQQLQPISMS